MAKNPATPPLNAKKYCIFDPSDTVQRERCIQYCLIDLRLKRSTALNYLGSIRAYYAQCRSFDLDSLRSFLASIDNPSTYNNHLKAFNNWARFNGGGPLLFRFSPVDPPMIIPPSNKEIREFYNALEWDYERLAFAGYCATGLRRSELLNIALDQIDTASRAVYPGHFTHTKRALMTFYNSEFEDLLTPWLEGHPRPKSNRLFSVSGSAKSCLFQIAQKRTGLDITPQKLRQWFVKAMGDRGVPDRFIDYFTGHIPRSVLARHYTDYSLENLKAVYEKAALKIL